NPSRRCRMADHNDPNAVNSIFSDIDVSAADLYDIFGFPGDDSPGNETVVIALTFASVPATGTLDPDMLYRIQIHAAPRVGRFDGDHSLEALLKYFDSIKEKYLGPLGASEIRVTVDQAGSATVKFMNFPCGSFSSVVATNQSLSIDSPDGYAIKTYIGGRAGAFFYYFTCFFPSPHYPAPLFFLPSSMLLSRVPT